MAEFARLTECSNFPELGFLEREVTPEPAMKFGIQLYLAGLLLSDTVSAVEYWGAERCGSNHVALDEFVIQVND